MRHRKLGDIFSEGEGSLVNDLREGFLQGNFPRDIDIRIKTKDLRNVICNVSFASVLREEPSAHREQGAVLCSFRDVTRQREVEAELQQTKDFLQRVIDSSVDAIISADMKGKIVLFNRAAERIYGKTSREVVGSDVRQLYPEGTAKKIMKMIRAGGGRIEGLKVDIVDANDATVPVSFSGALILDGATPVGSVGIFTDLREKMQMEQRLQAAQEQLLAQERQAIVAELAGAAAHELNQPLTSVRNYATLLRRLLASNTNASSAAEVIESEADRMAEIVRKIGKITKYETKSYVGKQKILDLDRASEEGAVAETAPSGGGTEPRSTPRSTTSAAPVHVSSVRPSERE